MSCLKISGFLSVAGFLIVGCSESEQSQTQVVDQDETLEATESLVLHIDPEPLSQLSALGIERSIVPVIGDIYRFFDNSA